MDYNPEQNNIRKILSAALVIFNGLIVLLYHGVRSFQMRGLLLFAMLFLDVYGFYILMLILTLKYHLDKKDFIITGAFDLKRIQVPVEKIESWSRHITLLDPTGMSFATARFALGKGFDNTGDKADLFITSSKKVIYLKTEKGNYGISPQDPDGFIAQLLDLGIPQQSAASRPALHKGDNKGRSSMNQLMLYGILLVAVLLLIPLITHFSGVLPELVKTSANSWISYNAYLESVFNRGVFALFLLLMGYGSTILLSSIEGKYYHQLLYFPLAIIVGMLFFEINVQLTMLTG